MECDNYICFLCKKQIHGKAIREDMICPECIYNLTRRRKMVVHDQKNQTKTQEEPLPLPPDYGFDCGTAMY